MSRLLHLLLLIGAVCGPAAAFVSDRDQRQQVNDVLTDKLFTVSNLLNTIQQHVQQLEGWDSSVSAIESRLAALESGQTSAAKQLESVLQRLETVSGDTAAVRADLADVATSQASSAAALVALRSDLTESISGVDESRDQSGELPRRPARGDARCVPGGRRRAATGASGRAADGC